MGRRKGRTTQQSCSLQGQGNFRPLDEGCGSYTAFRCPKSFKDGNKAGDHLSPEKDIIAKVCTQAQGPRRSGTRSLLPHRWQVFEAYL